MNSSRVAARMAAAAGGPISGRRWVAWWLLAVALLVAAMVLLGGFTRLTHSGLSMVEWRPVTGWLPPLDDAAWESEFAQYRQYPEYRLLNRDMTLEGFKGIYWPEYAHRLLGRVIGLVFGLPLLAALALRRIDARLGARLLLILLLGAGQGALGWYMVRSGLMDRPDVSHLRLTAHLTLAVAILGALLWTAFGQWTAAARGRPSTGAIVVVALVGLQIASGGLVAGLDAGLAYNTWPLMDGAFLPAAAVEMDPLWRNLLDNPAMTQFQHRVLAYAVLLALAAQWWRTRGAAGPPHRAQGATLALAVGQGALGVLTVLHGVPMALGVLHQAGALAVLTAALYGAWVSGEAPSDFLRRLP
jgi:cytochrome c oxidase assembly protein subunit 15